MQTRSNTARACAATAKLLVSGAIVFLFAGCVSSPGTPFSEHYYDQTEGVDVATNPLVESNQAEPSLFRGTDPERDAQGMVENGYALVGYSAFNAGSADDKAALSQARKVNAAIVLVYGHYAGGVNEINPFTARDDQVSKADSYATVGDNSIIRGTGEIYNPANGKRVNYFAGYWVRLKPPIFGASLENLGAAANRKSGIDRGMLVKAVVNESPAFHAGLKKEDILLRIGVVEIHSRKTFDDALKIYEGEEVDVAIYRNGKVLERRIRMPFAK
jgi:hypothetical protein